jgi:ATP-dependent RNA helicase DeaD
MFSATMPDEIRRIATATLRDPKTIEVEGGGSGPVVDHIGQRWMRVPQRNKLEALMRILQAETRGTTLVFARTRVSCAEVAQELARRGVSADALHGDLSQALRERVLGRLRSKSLELLVATDVAARGIDVTHITHVINLDLPGGPEIYAHRIGRTGRAGREGKAITLVTPREVGRFLSWQRKLRVDIEEVPPPTDAQIAARHRNALKGALATALDGPMAAGAARWLASLAEDKEWTPEQVAIAALGVLASEQGLALDEDPDERLSPWARPRERGRHHESHRHDDRGDPRRRGEPRGRPHQRPSGDEVQLFLAIGRRAGVRPSDVVGALANDVGIPGGRIGRISIFENKSLIGLAQEDAKKVLSITTSLNVRGRDTRLTWARSESHEGPRPEPPRQEPRRDGRGKFGARRHNNLPRKQRRS